MPILPQGLGKGLIDRVRQRLRNELGGGEAYDPTPGETRDDAVMRGIEFAQRVVNRLTRDRGESRGRMRRPPPSGPAEVMARAQEAGRRHVLLMAHYAAAHGQGPSWRYLGAYSFRYRGADDPSVPLLFCWCSIHHAPGSDGVEAFRLRRFLDLQVTDLPWTSPYWTVEF